LWKSAPGRFVRSSQKCTVKGSNYVNVSK